MQPFVIIFLFSNRRESRGRKNPSISRKKQCKKTVVKNMWISKLKGGSYIETARYDLFLLELQVTNYELNVETVSNLKKLLVKL